jgi:hypothetical protein
MAGQSCRAWDLAAQRRRTMSRCQRTIVSGVTSSPSLWRRVFGITLSSAASRARSAQFSFGRRGCRRCKTASCWRRIKISAVFHLSSRRDRRSHAATRVIRRKTNRRHMIGDHHGRTAGRATLLVRAVDEILGTHTPAGATGRAGLPAILIRYRTASAQWRFRGNLHGWRPAAHGVSIPPASGRTPRLAGGLGHHAGDGPPAHAAGCDLAWDECRAGLALPQSRARVDAASSPAADALLQVDRVADQAVRTPPRPARCVPRFVVWLTEARRH